ncbi:hypothetical protein YC2023_033705 [Brassica napus]
MLILLFVSELKLDACVLETHKVPDVHSETAHWIFENQIGSNGEDLEADHETIVVSRRRGDMFYIKLGQFSILSAHIIGPCKPLSSHINPHPPLSSSPPFMTKKYDMVEDPATDMVVCWINCRNSFMAWHPHKFFTTLLPRYFRNIIFPRFIHQLNTYVMRVAIICSRTAPRFDCFSIIHVFSKVSGCIIHVSKKLIEYMKRNRNKEFQSQVIFPPK